MRLFLIHPPDTGGDAERGADSSGGCDVVWNSVALPRSWPGLLVASEAAAHLLECHHDPSALGLINVTFLFP